MKKITMFITAMIFMIAIGVAQIHAPVKWTVASKKLNNKEAMVFIKATIQKGWHIYSQDIKDGGPIPTSFNFSKAGDYTVVGKTAEPKPKVKHEEVFKMDVGYFTDEVIFQQKISLNKGSATVKGNVEWQACDASQCLPPEEYTFAVTIK
ncbi:MULTISPECIES: protein-disulfide reductase DsbD N-terminal domain-containing protein [unclassified Sphingobacterium]|uniref:protein-disulfide reductase DsbD N-terminal domain-containing protein n=1 Tax=unclassified Sphingobacterium TaxID=2609468 RepID=UPI0010510C2D|nr:MULTISPECIES: protein-disulfide reductase DsbD N-terminal domain-containing protein [unclassified Sphingobacterium]MCS3556149.1 DsbC/DsbD-like thiol-disulfide interchange protein [Sphingobacterium sp. JUb21]TCR08525.1 disulfide bond corrector protein DsbC [Sphingobacterium sp. JUb20]